VDIRRLYQRRDGANLIVAADERGQGWRKVPSLLLGGDGQGDITREVGVDENEHSLGALQVTQAHLAELLKPPSSRETILCKLLDCFAN
jgi:hypothetical protein